MSDFRCTTMETPWEECDETQKTALYHLAMAQNEALKKRLTVVLTCVLRANLQLGDGHIRNAQLTLDEAMTDG